jgi:D-glycero-D-manno-heptose 1,7-bisphosphate phosphatase
MAVALFTDRDGTLIVDERYPKDPERVSLLPGASDALRTLRARGLRVVVVSNQSGVARGLLTEADVWRVHERMTTLLAASEAKVDAAYYCLHAPDAGCACRKPQPGLLLRAAREHGIDLQRSFLVGDKLSDVEAGRAAGCEAMLLSLPGGAPSGSPDTATGCAVVHGWAEVTAAVEAARAGRPWRAAT